MTPKKGVLQSYAVVSVTFEALNAFAEGLRGEDGKLKVDKDAAGAISMLVRSWDTAHERLRISKGKPLPGSLRPERRKGPVDPGLTG